MIEPEMIESEMIEPEMVEPEMVEPEKAVLKLDERWTFLAKRKRKVWRWLAVERATRRIVGWVLGCRGAATGRRLFQVLPLRYQTNTTYYTDGWEAYASVLPSAAHRPSAKGSGQTSIVEALNGSLRHRWGVLGRKSCSFIDILAGLKARGFP